MGLGLTVGGGGAPAAVVVRRAAFLMLALAAGLVGAALLAVPGATGAFFSWELAPEPLAAFAGGVYVASAAVYAAGLHAPWRAVRGLVAGAIVLSVSVSAITFAHLDAFDLDRGPAWAWIVLFAGFAVTTTALLVRGGGAGVVRSGDRLDPAARGALAASAGVLGAIGIALWVDPVGVSAAGPVALPALGARFAGAWIVLLAVLAAWAAAAGRREEARLPALALRRAARGCACRRRAHGHHGRAVRGGAGPSPGARRRAHGAAGDAIHDSPGSGGAGAAALCRRLSGPFPLAAPSIVAGRETRGRGASTWL